MQIRVLDRPVVHSLYIPHPLTITFPQLFAPYPPFVIFPAPLWIESAHDRLLPCSAASMRISVMSFFQAKLQLLVAAYVLLADFTHGKAS